MTMRSGVTRRRVLAGLGAVPAVGLGGCAYSGSVRYRLTVNVETPDGTRTGSGVIEASRKILYSWVPIPSNRESQELRGEAVAVDLGSRGVLFVLLTCSDSSNQPQDCGGLKLPERVLQRTGEVNRVNPGPYEEPWLVDTARKIEAARGVREVATGDLPFMVRFRDIGDPKTVEAVDPGDLAASFGSGVRLGRVSIEFTRDPVTTGIETKLGWLADYSSPDYAP